MISKIFDRPLTVFSVSCLLALSACGDNDSKENRTLADGPGTQSIAALIAGSSELSSVEALIENAGLAETFDGIAAYTVFAPNDAALEELGDSFAGDEARPALVAILREHIVPGYLTRDDIVSAIESSGEPVEMQTMGAGTLTFSLNEGQLIVTTTDGDASSSVTEEMLGANGVVIPVDSVLKDIEPAA
ncbi:hypothetical protein CP97_12245 [Aurantiacibacter atlanticus]|uniref:FAS1 domain-containing protein n=1 Tax=Aurantiacibacter atlanticus TaxID=1648404 RepID=A0A0H4VI80_9SPHN|nr:fasciclin domain-containing protein [Aurantiacibacter atlanticus]AKQ42639.1 hypothetical protein CP97_12245 [Aurantiacibacter atlanticus]MDF1835136.1 fasciclin domain-containing protein [Alteraurantiacibacter sp. bin_em_oilr2.035]